MARKPKLKLVSKSRHRASAAERRRYGGKTVTVFLAMPDESDVSTWFDVTGYGPTPGERKTDARKKAEAMLAERENPCGCPEGTIPRACAEANPVMTGSHARMLWRLYARPEDGPVSKHGLDVLRDLERLGWVDVTHVSGPYWDPRELEHGEKVKTWDVRAEITPEGRREYEESGIEAWQEKQIREIVRDSKKREKKNPRPRTSEEAQKIRERLATLFGHHKGAYTDEVGRLMDELDRLEFEGAMLHGGGENPTDPPTGAVASLGKYAKKRGESWAAYQTRLEKAAAKEGAARDLTMSGALYARAAKIAALRFRRPAG